ncbi:hypothetical protein H5410_060341, partial [Solanum commersonii]
SLFTGCIPYELGLLRIAIVIDIGFNMLTGSLSCSLECLKNVDDQLNFAKKLLYGQIPEVMCSLRNIWPLCRELIKNEVLNVEKNCIIGLPNKRSIPKCVIFRMQIRNKGREIY